MKLRDFLKLYEMDTKITIYDSVDRKVFCGNVFGAKICDYKHYKVFSFGFYDGTLCVRVGK